MDDITEEEWAERLDEMAVMFNSDGWRYFLDMVEEMSDYADNIETMETVEDLYRAKGFTEALSRVLTIESMVEQSRATVE